MLTSRPSISKALLAGLIGLGAGAAAPEPGRRAIGAEGAAAMDRLEQALRNAKDLPDGAPSPQLPRTPTPPERRRAFEGLKQRSANPAMETRARAANAAAQAGLAAERAKQARVLRQALGLEPGEEQALAKAVPAAPKGWVPVLFASSSMPSATLRSYAAQLERVHGVIAFRGVPGGMKKITPLARLSAEVLRIDPGCEGPACRMRSVQIVVDPILFRQFTVRRVPALVMVPGDPTLPYCERGDDEAPPVRGTAPLVYGDSALSGLLEEYARLGGKEEVRDAQALLSNP